MAPAAARTLLALILTFSAASPGLTDKPLQPRNVRVTSVGQGLKVSWEPPDQLDGRPVDRYNIGYGKSMKTLRFIKVDKDRRSEVLEDVEPGLLHFLKMSAENEEGSSRPVYRAETPGGGEWVKLDGFAVMGGALLNASSQGSPRSPAPSRRLPPGQRGTGGDPHTRPSVLAVPKVKLRAPQSSSGPRPPERMSVGAPLLDRRNIHTQPQADQRSQRSPQLASESVYVVSLQAHRPHGQSLPGNRPANPKTHTPEPEEYEAQDISVRVLSPQSVLISWVDPAVEKEKVTPGGSRHYTIKYREKGESARWEFKTTNQRRLLIDTLSADGMYEFSVRISQGDDHGKWSVSVFQRTPESVPSGPPENFLVEPLRGKGTAVMATWDQPEEPNGRIREYIVSYAPAMKPFSMKTMTYRGSASSAVIEGLQPGERYIFKIRATNRKGLGPQSKAHSVAMPGTSRAASSVSQHSTNQDTRRTAPNPSHAPKQDSHHDNTDHPSAEATEEPTVPTETAPSLLPSTRRTRPLTQSRSYHSIFSSVRGSGRNVATNQRLGGGSSRGRISEDRQEDDQSPSPSPEDEEKLANEAVDEKQPGNVVLSREEEEGYGKDPAVPDSFITEVKDIDTLSKPSSSLPLRKPLPGRRTSPAFNPRTSSNPEISRPRRPLSRTSGSLSRTQGLDTGSSSSSSSSSSSLSSSTTTSSSGSHSQESAAIRKDHITSAYTEGKHTYDQPGETDVKPATLAPTPDNPASEPEMESPSLGRGSGSTGRGFGARLGYGRRKPGVVTRVNPSRVQTGLRTLGSAKTQSTLSNGAKTQESSQASNTHTAESHTPNIGSTNRHTVDTHVPNKRTHSSVLPDPQEAAHDRDEHKHTHAVTKDPTPRPRTTITTPATTPPPGEEGDQTGEESRTLTHDLPPSRVNPPERLPHHLSRHQARPGLGTRVAGETGVSGATRVSSPRADGRVPWSRTASSVGAGRPYLREMPTRTRVAGATGVSGPTRVSAATGAAGVSGVQETNPDLKNPSSPSSPSFIPLKNDLGAKSHKPSLPNRSGSRNTITSSSSSSSSSSSTNSGSSSGHRHSSEPISRGGSRGEEDTDNDHDEDYLDEGSKEIFDRNQKIPDPTPAPKTSTSLASSPLRPAHEGGVVDRGSSPRARTGSFSFIPVPVPRRPIPGTGTRVRSPLLANRQPALTSEAGQGSRTHYPSRANGGVKPGYGNGKNGRPNLTATRDKESSSTEDQSKASRKQITGPDGTKWVVDLEKGVLMNEEGRVLQDSNGRPRRVVLGEDGRTIFDHEGSPLVNQEGLALFGNSRDSRPVVNPKEKFLTVGGKPVVGLNRPKPKTTTTNAPPTTTPTPTPTTPEWTTEEPTTLPGLPTCPPGTLSRLDSQGFPLLDQDGFLNCYPHEESSGMEMDSMVTVAMVLDALAVEEDELLPSTTLPPPTTSPPTPEPDPRPFNNSPSSEYDVTGKKRFTAPYLTYIQKDPGAPCSLTEALEYLQVDVLENLLEKDNLATNQNQPPKNKPHNITVVAMEGCHSFVILDWARPLKDDMVSGYMVHSASYDDVLNNRWSSSSSSGTHLPIENLKPNSRYYFKVQAKNIFGLGPVSDMVTYVTESDDPLLIERPPGGEPIWIPFSFRFNPAHSACKGSQFVKRTWYRKFVGVVLCNSLRYKIFMGDALKDVFYSIADTYGHGEDHCQFVDSYLDGRTGLPNLSNHLPAAQGYYRAHRQEPVTFGAIGRRTHHPFVGWYECGVPIPGKW